MIESRNLTIIRGIMKFYLEFIVHFYYRNADAQNLSHSMLKPLTSSSHLTRPVPPGSLVSGYLYSAAGYYGIFGTSLGMTHTIVLQPDT